MSLGYAEKLSYREDLGGTLGGPEHFDQREELERKVQKLAELVSQAKRIVAFTGAGISTSCGIPDFRGPNGIWTLQRAGKPLPKPKVGFAHAKPSLTHQALVALLRSGKLTYLVSQNVDGLHLRSGVPRDKLAELHGNCFAERCPRCRTEYIRDFEIETVGFKRTGRRCIKPACGGALVDHILDWEDELPADELEQAEQHAKEADLAICLGTSLQITPACNLPLKATRQYKALPDKQPGKLVIVNLQRTQHDNKAVKSGGLVIHARCDEVMQLLVQKLGMALPPYRRHDAVIAGHVQHPAAAGAAAAAGAGQQENDAAEAEAAGKAEDDAHDGAVQEAGSTGSAEGQDAGPTSCGIPFTVYVRSRHGPKCLMPMVDSVEFSFPSDPRLKGAVVSRLPFSLRRTARSPGPITVHIKLRLHDTADADKRTVDITYSMDLQQPPAPASRGRAAAAAANPGSAGQQHEQLVEFLTQEVEFQPAGGPTAESAAAPKAEAQQELSNGCSLPGAKRQRMD